MSNYCTQQDMIDRFGNDTVVELTDRAIPPTNTIDTTVLDRAIEDATSFINGFLQSRYTLPLSSIPSVIKRLAVDITRYYLHDEHVPEHVDNKFKSAEKTLKSVSKGEVNLGIDTLGVKPSSKNDVEIQSGGNVFNRSDNGFI